MYHFNFSLLLCKLRKIFKTKNIKITEFVSSKFHYIFYLPQKKKKKKGKKKEIFIK